MTLIIFNEKWWYERTDEAALSKSILVVIVVGRQHPKYKSKHFKSGDLTKMPHVLLLLKFFFYFFSN